MELFQSAGRVCKYTNLGYNRRTHAPPGNLSKPAWMAEGKTGAKPNEPRRDEKRKAFRPSRTSAPQRPSQAHPKVCIYFHSPLLISTRMPPLTPVHPRKGNVSVISFPKLSADAPQLSAALPPVSSAEPFKSPTHNMRAGGKPHASDGLQRLPEPFLGSNATGLTGAKNTVNPACEIGGRPAQELWDVQAKAGPRQTAGRERMFWGQSPGKLQSCQMPRCLL